MIQTIDLLNRNPVSYPQDQRNIVIAEGLFLDL